MPVRLAKNLDFLLSLYIFFTPSFLSPSSWFLLDTARGIVHSNSFHIRPSTYVLCIFISFKSFFLAGLFFVRVCLALSCVCALSFSVWKLCVIFCCTVYFKNIATEIVRAFRIQIVRVLFYVCNYRKLLLWMKVVSCFITPWLRDETSKDLCLCRHASVFLQCLWAQSRPLN